MTKLLEHLHLYTGSETFYRHALVRRIVFTEGAHYVAKEAGAFWLLDQIALAQLDNTAVQNEEFQVWKLAVHDNKAGTLTCEDGNGNLVYTNALTFTDFPAPGIELWFADNTIYLPSEH